MAITLTERAAAEVKRVKEEQKVDPEMFLRIRIAAGGCSGFNYALGFDSEFDEKADSKYDCSGVDVVVDKKSSLYLDGTTVDFLDSIERRGFAFDNPNVIRTCGCGGSFQA
jgi:iron-sulfur cluster assembly protein